MRCRKDGALGKGTGFLIPIATAKGQQARVTQTFPTFPAAAALRAVIERGLREEPLRIRPLTGPDGERLWLKRAETLSLRLRLQKGDSAKGFEKDRQGLHLLGAAGLPVAPILAEGADFFVTPDLGVTLQTLLRDSDMPQEAKLAPFAAAGAALAQLHSARYCHGRPSIRDICWDGVQARFIDLERFSAERRDPASFSMDVLIFVHSVFAVDRRAQPVLDCAIRAYRAGVPDAVWAAVRRKGARFGWVGPVTAPLRWLRPQSRDLNALPLTLAYIADQAA